jgi:signal transduction histidine kinase
VTSLRRRILIGSILWAIGMIVISSAVFSLLMDHSPRARRAIPAHLHGTLQAPLIVSAALLCLVFGALQVRRGLKRIDDLHVQLTRLRKGQGRRLEGDFPSEVQPLVRDLNSLLEQREQAVGRAIAKAGDLAHGLKTPLAVLTREAEAAGRSGQDELAESMRQQIDRMRRQIDYHLAHARAAASGGTTTARTSVRDAAEGLARVMRHVHAERGVEVIVECPDGHDVRVQREDLDEMLGNLLDNACKWARAQVVVRSARDDERIVVTVDDDGPGIAEEMRAAVLQRGVRADEATPGTGLGLAIVRDLAEVYGGSIALASSPTGGCRAVLKL